MKSSIEEASSRAMDIRNAILTGQITAAEGDQLLFLLAIETGHRLRGNLGRAGEARAEEAERAMDGVSREE